jgi:tetratricopeptide (TPR) repeat protein
MKILILLAAFLFIPVYGESIEQQTAVSIPEKAMELVKSNKPAEALRLISAYSPSVDELASYHYIQAKAYQLENRLTHAIEQFRLAYVYAKQGESRERILIERSENYLKMRYYPEAAVSFRIYLRQFPDSPNAERAYLGLADALFRTGNYNEAILQYKKSGSSSHSGYGMANALHALGEIREANDLYAAMLAKDREYPDNSQDTLLALGDNYRQMSRFGEAKGYLGAVKDPFLKHKADIGLGMISMEEGRIDEAIEYFNAATQSPERQTRRKALLSLAFAFLKTGKQDEAKARLLEIRNRYPYGKDYDAALFRLAQIHKKENRFQDAVSLLNELVFRRSPDRDALNEFESIILEAKDKDEEGFLRLWRSVGHWLLDPSRSSSLQKMAEGLKYSGRPFLEICNWLQKNGSPEVKEWSQIHLAGFHADMGDTATAARYLQSVKSGSDDVIRIRARVDLAEGRHDRAVQSIVSIRNIKQEDIILLSELIKKTGASRKVIAFYEKGLNTTGGTSGAYVALADTLFDAGRKQEALNYYRTAASMRPEGPAFNAGDIEWARYRVGNISQGDESKNALKGLQNGNTVLNRLSVAESKEAGLAERIEGVF